MIQAEGTTGSKGEIDQFSNLKLLLRLEVDKEQALMRFGARHASFKAPKTNNANKKSKTLVHGTISVPVRRHFAYY